MNSLEVFQNELAEISPLILHDLIIASFVGLALMFLLIALFITRKKKVTSVKLMDVESIAGDDVVTTQLDLAKAYLEMDKKDFAKEILKNVIKTGSKEQKKVAKQLILETN